jgi:hypothetical protein
MSPKSWAAAALLPAVSVLWVSAFSARAQGQGAAARSGTAITGVYTGTLTCSNNQVNVKLSLVGTVNNTVTGFLMFDLPPDVGSQGIYRVEGRYWGYGPFTLTTTPIGTPAPRGFAMAQVNGSYYPGSPIITGRVVHSGCDFYAKRAPAESPEAVAEIAQKGPAPWTAPAPPSAAAIAAYRKDSAPAVLASPGLVRKSQAYWSGYGTDIIRQVFDGGFGYDLGTSPQFQLLFNTYVEFFSKQCRAYLPAHHEAVTITQVTTKRDRYGNVISQQNGQPATVEVDSRFAAKYRQYWKSLTSPQQSLGVALGVMSGRGANAYFDPGTDTIKFFETETCQSAATRQLGENLLRAATGERSLQETGATIAGATAESDKNLPPGRYTHFVDGCNAFFRDPANARTAPRDAGGYCSCLANQYRGVMTAEEEYFYANDFGRRFRNEITQPKELAKDPAWPRLHTAVDKCRR